MGILEDVEQSSVTEELAETEDTEAANSERIFWIPPCIYYIFLRILEDYIKAAGNSEKEKVYKLRQFLEYKLNNMK